MCGSEWLHCKLSWQALSRPGFILFPHGPDPKSYFKGLACVGEFLFGDSRGGGKGGLAAWHGAGSEKENLSPQPGAGHPEGM